VLLPVSNFFKERIKYRRQTIPYHLFINTIGFFDPKPKKLLILKKDKILKLFIRQNLKEKLTPLGKLKVSPQS